MKCTASSLSKVPITQDASASAYQIMGYFLLDQDVSRQTPSKDGLIQDVYASLKDSVLIYLSRSPECQPMFPVIQSILDRQIDLYAINIW